MTDTLPKFFCYMQPMDLLNLARTSKEFRALLMNRSSAVFWKNARKNVERFPDCPPFLSEPAFANVAFSNHCHVRVLTRVRRRIDVHYSD